jgi:hypothetical protein
MLLTLLVATLVMPVNYRAGAADEHAHTIFQGLIDAIVGHPHHHDEATAESAGPATARTAISPFGNLSVPLVVQVQAERAAANPRSPDAPRLLAFSMPISDTSAIQALGLLVAALLAGEAIRPLWDQRPRLTAWRVAIEPPPPRPAGPPS